ncbi:hypothetical protein N7522_004735 [Penicillium canescens]|uniref:Uncharacterized protein n=1 Tax=Penicillium canescens TaxID=5083 RepID=A0AAD6I0Q7_PENCN|nr:uncharacterized protein N7446_004619 [Penicillium canescens]KAJ6009719.1 hypothetical protein N7522_004735 [Penicillium canescens]KAJ6026781.1 hypothetical protein N7460_011598 [Penicillium canescens]KAJ6040066.1 hypothetical protein N7444_008971 [Penicillium canescens]KAJ6067582.1 hypothetical protein N7446_004619 [Penicillium canescens]
MSGSNPFRARNLGNPADPQSKNAPNPPQSTPTIANGYPGKSSISLELEVDDSSSDENPFNPDALASDSEASDSASKSSAPGDRRAFFGSAPLPAPSPDGSSTPSSTQPSISTDRNVQSASGDGPVAPDASRDRSQRSLRSEAQSSPSQESTARTREKKPPPPPKSHHGKRISHTATTMSDVDADAHSSQSAARWRSSNRLSIHGSSTERVTPGASHPSSVSLPSAADYFSVSENQAATEPTDSLQRSHSQKRPPTPPLSRRHSQMRRSKSTQSKSSRLTMSSYDSERESNSSLPSSPGPTRSLASKRISMPPPSSSGEFQAAIPSGDVSLNPLGSPSSRSPSLKAGRRASSYGSVPSNSSSGPPPPPPPRRTRDSAIRSSAGDSPPVSRVATDEDAPLPQPSNALDILADLTKLQKEVDDLRGHYENRKVE